MGLFKPQIKKPLPKCPKCANELVYSVRFDAFETIDAYTTDQGLSSMRKSDNSHIRLYVCPECQNMTFVTIAPSDS